MRLPNPDRAIVEIEKLRHYCLSPLHEDGKHKARVFASALGLNAFDADWLRLRILEAASGEAFFLSDNKFGALYTVDFELTTQHGSATVRSGWIVRAGGDSPRLTTCFVIPLVEKKK